MTQFQNNPQLAQIRPSVSLAPDSGDDNRRSSPRRRALRSGRILWNHRSSSMDCVIRDQSEGGVRIRLTDACPLPKQVELHFVNDNQVIACELRWNRGNEYGLLYTGPLQALEN